MEPAPHPVEPRPVVDAPAARHAPERWDADQVRAASAGRRSPLLRLQRAAGNRAVSALLDERPRRALSFTSPPIRRQLAVSELQAGAADELTDLVNRNIFGGKYRLVVLPTTPEQQGWRLLALHTVDPGRQIDPQAERFHGLLRRMVDSGVRVMVQLGRGHPDFTVAHFSNRAIDIRDIAAFGGAGMAGVNGAAVLAHELWEQYTDQSAGGDGDDDENRYEVAHAAGIQAEEHVLGVPRIGDYMLTFHPDPPEVRRIDVYVHGDGARLVMSLSHVAQRKVEMVRRVDITAAVTQLVRALGAPYSETLDDDGPGPALASLRAAGGQGFVNLCEQARQRADR